MVAETARRDIIACNVVGSMQEVMPPGTLVIPTQVIDYTYGREHTFFDGTQHRFGGDYASLQHVDFSMPFFSTFC